MPLYTLEIVIYIDIFSWQRSLLFMRNNTLTQVNEDTYRNTIFEGYPLQCVAVCHTMLNVFLSQRGKNTGRTTIGPGFGTSQTLWQLALRFWSWARPGEDGLPEPSASIPQDWGELRHLLSDKKAEWFTPFVAPFVGHLDLSLNSRKVHVGVSFYNIALARPWVCQPALSKTAEVGREREAFTQPRGIGTLPPGLRNIIAYT